jgi:pseudouridine synthase
MQAGDVHWAGRAVTGPATTLPLTELLESSTNLTVAGRAVRVVTTNASVSSSLSSSSEFALVNQSLQSSQPPVRVWLVHKLAGELVTEVDPEYNRPSLLQRMKQSGVGKVTKSSFQHLKPIGRLDMNTEGLMVLTNCGAYARDMELPLHQLHRTYRVRVHGALAAYKLAALRRGGRYLAIHDKSRSTSSAAAAAAAPPLSSKRRKGSTAAAAQTRTTAQSASSTTSTAMRYYGPMQVTVEATRKRSTATNQWLQITCTEGKNRQIRNALAHYGCTYVCVAPPPFVLVDWGDHLVRVSAICTDQLFVGFHVTPWLTTVPIPFFSHVHSNGHASHSHLVRGLPVANHSTRHGHRGPRQAH